MEKSPTTNPADAPALLDVGLHTPLRKECSCLPVPPSSRLCHAKGDIHIRCANLCLAWQILELPPFHRLGLQDGVKHPTMLGLEIWCLASPWLSVLLFPHQINPHCLPSQSSCEPSVLVKGFAALGQTGKARRNCKRLRLRWSYGLFEATT